MQAHGNAATQPGLLVVVLAGNETSESMPIQEHKCWKHVHCVALNEEIPRF